MRLIILFIAALICFGAPTEAQAKFRFGNHDSMTMVQDVPLTGPKGEDLILSRRLTTTFFGAGLWLKDNGYVLAIRRGDGYYPMPEGDKLKLLQAANMLPNPLPEFKVQTSDYLMGYSLYLIILGLVLWGLLKKAFRRKPAVPVGKTN